jgi:hypothetical protein
MTEMNRRIASTTLLAAATLLAGCSTQGNDRASLGAGEDRVELDALREPERPESEPAPDAVSVTSISRSNWGTQVVLVPVDGTSAQRTFTRPYQWTNETNRQRGGYPLPTSALEMSGDTSGMQWREALSSPFLAGWDLLLMGPRMIIAAPWTERRSIPQPYWRASTDQTRTLARPEPTPAETASEAPEAPDAPETPDAAAPQ